MNFKKIAEGNDFPIQAPTSEVMKAGEIKSVVKNNKKTANVEQGKEGNIPSGGEEKTGVKYSKTGSLIEENFDKKLKSFLKEFKVPEIDNRLDDLEFRLENASSDDEIEAILDEINGEKRVFDTTERLINDHYREDTDMNFPEEKKEEPIQESKIQEDKVNHKAIIDDSDHDITDLTDWLETAFEPEEIIQFLVEKAWSAGFKNFEVYYADETHSTMLCKNVKNRGWPQNTSDEDASFLITQALNDVSNVVEENTEGNLEIIPCGRLGGHWGFYKKEADNMVHNSIDCIKYYLGYLFDFDIAIPMSTEDEEYGEEMTEIDVDLEEILTNVKPTAAFEEIERVWEATIYDLENTDFNKEEPVEEPPQQELPFNESLQRSHARISGTNLY